MSVPMPRKATLLGLAVVLPGALCDTDPVDPPKLDLGFAVKPSAPRGTIVVRNGAGEEVLRSEDEDGVFYAAPPDVQVSDLDGRMDITIERGGSVVYRQSLDHPPGRPIRVRWREDRFEVEEEEEAAAAESRTEDSSFGE